jgi:hypothetical protein
MSVALPTMDDLRAVSAPLLSRLQVTDLTHLSVKDESIDCVDMLSLALNIECRLTGDEKWCQA